MRFIIPILLLGLVSLGSGVPLNKCNFLPCGAVCDVGGGSNGMFGITVMSYCGPSGKCEMNARPNCDTVNTDKLCCKANIASCQACVHSMTVDEYCTKEPETVGCNGSKPNVCCLALTAQCLACKESISPIEYCQKNPATPGCKPVNPNETCSAMSGTSCSECTDDASLGCKWQVGRCMASCQIADVGCYDGERATCPQPESVCKAASKSCSSCSSSGCVWQNKACRPTCAFQWGTPFGNSMDTRCYSSEDQCSAEEEAGVDEEDNGEEEANGGDIHWPILPDNDCNCRDMSAKCLACHASVSVAELCKNLDMYDLNLPAGMVGVPKGCLSFEVDDAVPQPGSECAENTPPFVQTIVHCGEKIEGGRCDCENSMWLCMTLDLPPCPPPKPPAAIPTAGSACLPGTPTFKQYTMHCGEKVLTMQCDCDADAKQWLSCMTVRLAQCSTAAPTTTAVERVCAAATKKAACANVTGCAWDGKTFAKGGRCRAFKFDLSPPTSMPEPGSECRAGTPPYKEYTMHCGKKTLVTQCDCEHDVWLDATPGVTVWTCMMAGMMPCSTSGTRATTRTTTTAAPSTAATDVSTGIKNCVATKRKSQCSDIAGCMWFGKTYSNGGRCQEEKEEDDKCAAITKRQSCKDAAVAAGCSWAGKTYSKGGRCSSPTTETDSGSSNDAGGDAADGPRDDKSWAVGGKKRQNCAWTKAKAARCKKVGVVDSGDSVLGYSACPETCGDDPKWRAATKRQNCAWAKGKKSRCLKESSKDGRLGWEACPVACAAFYKQ